MKKKRRCTHWRGTNVSEGIGTPGAVSGCEVQE